MIPKYIHQTWKTKEVPKEWIPFVIAVQSLNPNWNYRLWTDTDNDEFVSKEYPEFTNIFKNFSKGIMRADVIRYLIMYKLGGVYLDLDYEILKPFDFGDKEVVLPLCRSVKYGDEQNMIGNCFMASVPGHRFWLDVINDLRQNPPLLIDYSQIIQATGPGLLTRIYNKNRYPDIDLPERLIYHPPSPKSLNDIEKIKNNGVSRGIHYCGGSWIKKGVLTYLRNKVLKHIR